MNDVTAPHANEGPPSHQSQVFCGKKVLPPGGGKEQKQVHKEFIEVCGG